jgi:hypothetical protein
MDDSHLEILHKVVEYPQSFRILAILNIDQGTDFGGLEDTNQQISKTI